MSELTIGQKAKISGLVSGIFLGDDEVWYKKRLGSRQIDSHRAGDVAFGLQLICDEHGDSATITEINGFWIHFTVARPLTREEVDDLRFWAENLRASE